MASQTLTSGEQGLGEQLFAGAQSVVIGGGDERHTRLDGPPDHGDGGVPVRCRSPEPVVGQPYRAEPEPAHTQVPAEAEGVRYRYGAGSLTDMTGARPMTEPSQFPPSQPAPPYPYAPYPPPFNTYAILSLVFAVFVFAPLGIYFGQVAKRQIAQTGERGIELANVGIICGWIFSVLLVIWCGFFAFVITGGISSSR